MTNRNPAELGTTVQIWLSLETTYQLAKAQPVSERIAIAATLREIATDILDCQEPLPPDFEAIWSDNTDVLYQS